MSYLLRLRNLSDKTFHCLENKCVLIFFAKVLTSDVNINFLKASARGCPKRYELQSKLNGSKVI